MFADGVTTNLTIFRRMWSDSYIRDLLDGSVHALAGGALHLISGMAVYINGKGCGGVSKILLHGFDIIAMFQRGNGKAATEVIRACTPSASHPSAP